MRIKKSAAGLKAAQVYPHLSTHLGCTNISIPADFSKLKPVIFLCPISILGEILAKAINTLLQPVEVWVHPAPSPCSHLPSHGACLLVIHLDEFAKATGVVVMGCFCISKCLWKEGDPIIMLEKSPPCLISMGVTHNWTWGIFLSFHIKKKKKGRMGKVCWGVHDIIQQAAGHHVPLQAGVHEEKLNNG